MKPATYLCLVQGSESVQLCCTPSIGPERCAQGQTDSYGCPNHRNYLLKNKHWSHCPAISKSNGRLHMSMVISAQDMTVRSNWTCSIITQWCKWRGTGRMMIARGKTEVAFKQNTPPITSLITHAAFSAMLGLLNSRNCSYKVVCNLTARILTWPWVAMTVNYCYNCRQWRLIIVYFQTCFRVNENECAPVGKAT